MDRTGITQQTSTTVALRGEVLHGAPTPRALRVGGTFAGPLQWAQQHLDQPITVDILAARAAMSPRTFARRFRQQMGTTPGSWLNRQRLLLAERLLERGDQTIASVSARSGFGSPDTLRRHFARVRGTTPEQYRRAFRTSGPR